MAVFELYSNPLPSIRWLICRNDAGEEIPAGAVLHINGVTFVEGHSVLTVTKPGSAWQRWYAVSGPWPIPAGAYGSCTLDGPVWAWCDPQTTPQPGQSWGVKPGEWRLFPHRPGFTVLGGLVHQRVLVLPQTVDQLLGKTDGTLGKGASGMVSLWFGPAGSETDSSLDVIAWNRFATVAAGRWVGLVWIQGAWYLNAAEC
jgi:hypothetical protein